MLVWLLTKQRLYLVYALRLAVPTPLLGLSQPTSRPKHTFRIVVRRSPIRLLMRTGKAVSFMPDCIIDRLVL